MSDTDKPKITLRDVENEFNQQILAINKKYDHFAVKNIGKYKDTMSLIEGEYEKMLKDVKKEHTKELTAATKAFVEAIRPMQMEFDAKHDEITKKFDLRLKALNNMRDEGLKIFQDRIDSAIKKSFDKHLKKLAVMGLEHQETIAQMTNKKRGD